MTDSKMLDKLPFVSDSIMNIKIWINTLVKDFVFSSERIEILPA